MPHSNNILNDNAEIETDTSQTVISETVGRLVHTGVTLNSDLSKFVNMLPRGNQAETTSAASLITAERTKFVNCASDNSGFVTPLSNTSIVMSSFSTDYNTENLPSVDTPDACDKAANR